MKINLMIDGKKKEFYSRGLNARASLKAFEYLEEIENNVINGEGKLYSEEQVERLLDFVVSLFNNQFTEDEFLDGYEGSFYSDVPEMLRSVIAGFMAKTEEFPNALAPKDK